MLLCPHRMPTSCLGRHFPLRLFVLLIVKVIRLALLIPNGLPFGVGLISGLRHNAWWSRSVADVNIKPEALWAPRCGESVRLRDVGLAQMKRARVIDPPDCLEGMIREKSATFLPC